MSKPKFTLASLKKRAKDLTYFVPVEEELFIVSLEGQKHPELDDSASPAEKLYNVLKPNPNDPEEWGLLFPKKWGITTGEDEEIRAIANKRDEVMLDFRNLVVEVCEETGLKFPEASTLVSNYWDNQSNPAIFKRTDKIVKIMNRFNSSDTRRGEVTAIIQSRLIPDWTEFDTLLTNVVLFDRISAFFDGERSGWEQERIESEGKRQKALKASENELPESENTSSKVLAGTTAT